MAYLARYCYASRQRQALTGGSDEFRTAFMPKLKNWPRLGTGAFAFCSRLDRSSQQGRSRKIFRNWQLFERTFQRSSN
jgi:hypothetical protein